MNAQSCKLVPLVHRSSNTRTCLYVRACVYPAVLFHRPRDTER